MISSSSCSDPKEVQFVRIGLNADIEFFAGPSVAILVTPIFHNSHRSAEKALSTAHSLTPAESRVLAGILAGKKLREVAEANGIGLETVRSQLKGIYFKTGVNSQAALVRVASGLADRLPAESRNRVLDADR